MDLTQTDKAVQIAKPAPIDPLAKYGDIFPYCTHLLTKKEVDNDCSLRFGPEIEKYCSSCIKAKELREIILNYEVLKQIALRLLRDQALNTQPDPGLKEELWYRATNEL